MVELTGKNNGCPFLDILTYLKNTHKNPKFGKVRQIPTREFPTKVPDWDLSHPSKLGGFLWVFFKFPKISKNGNRLFFPVTAVSPKYSVPAIDIVSSVFSLANCTLEK